MAWPCVGPSSNVRRISRSRVPCSSSMRSCCSLVDILGEATGLPIECQGEQELSAMRPTPDKFYKGRSQEKTPLRWLKVFLLLSPLNGARSVLTARTRCSVAGHFGPAIWVFSTSGFHCLFATKPVCRITGHVPPDSLEVPFWETAGAFKRAHCQLLCLCPRELAIPAESFGG